MKNYGVFGKDKSLAKYKEYSVYAHNKQGDIVGFASAVGYRNMLQARKHISTDSKRWIKFDVKKYNKVPGR